MDEIIFYKKPDYIKDLSKKLRQNQTQSEKMLWEKLRWKKINWLIFHRQKTLFAFRENNWLDRFYIADFYCHSKRLIIELDWKIHDSENQKEYDKIREEILKNNNFKIIRFKNEEIIKNIDKIEEVLEKWL